MSDGRVVVRGRMAGAGFCVTDRIVATAAHVVRGRTAQDVAFETAAGHAVAVERIDVDATIDVAMMWLVSSLPVVAPLAEVLPSSEWCVTARPRGNDPRLTGTVTAVDHLIDNSGGHEMSVLQLHVREDAGQYGGYSGSAVTVDGAVVGILVEQVPERGAGNGGPPRSANVLYAVPIAHAVRRFRLAVPVHSATAGPPAARQLLDPAHFDLDEVKSGILAAKAAASQRRVLAFAMGTADPVVVHRLCDWLPPYLGELERKEWINLDPVSAAVDAAVKSACRYEATLRRVGVVCPVRVDGAPAMHVARFHEQVLAAYPRPEHWLVLLYAGEVPHPTGVVPLPPPRFVPADIAAWARDVCASRRWPARLAAVWTDRLLDEASDGTELSVRFTYEALQDAIRLLRQDPAALRRDLEEESER
ncbi:serine protease [Dactylosporangium sp. NPDC005555]|uniref:S1 family peptidase n=1 Tax=Dactylosporangium sp. NPDC005555 TaxID=3154889 RepID=UPI0033A992B3